MPIGGPGGYDIPGSNSGGSMNPNNYYTKDELNGGVLDTRYFTENELLTGALDGRYFTETELTTGGVLDTRYFTQPISDSRYIINQTALNENKSIRINRILAGNVVSDTLESFINQGTSRFKGSATFSSDALTGSLQIFVNANNDIRLNNNNNKYLSFEQFGHRIFGNYLTIDGGGILNFNNSGGPTLTAQIRTPSQAGIDISGSNGAFTQTFASGLYLLNFIDILNTQVNSKVAQIRFGHTLNMNPNTITASTMWGILYDPVVTALYGAAHRAWENVTGDMIFGSTSGRTQIGPGTTDTTSLLEIFLNVTNPTAKIYSTQNNGSYLQVLPGGSNGSINLIRNNGLNFNGLDVNGATQIGGVGNTTQINNNVANNIILSFSFVEKARFTPTGDLTIQGYLQTGAPAGGTVAQYKIGNTKNQVAPLLSTTYVEWEKNGGGILKVPTIQ